jgi:hypothetical protein
VASPGSRIALVLPYYGDWPVWFPAFLHSCRSNADVDWLIVTDRPGPAGAPDNVHFLSWTLAEIRDRAEAALGYPVALASPYKLCDVRPAFGIIFQESLQGYDFWGHCDMDIVWGDIRAFVSAEILAEHDVISARRGNVAGHFTLYRNDATRNRLFERDPRYPVYLGRPEPMFFDEVGITKILQRDGNEAARVYWPRFLLNYPDAGDGLVEPSRLGPLRNRWVWERGTLYHREGESRREVMYLHFMTWKRSLVSCAFGVDDRPEMFYLSYSHIGLTEDDPPPGTVTERLRRWWAVKRLA